MNTESTSSADDQPEAATDSELNGTAVYPDTDQIKQIIEAALLAAGQPLTVAQLTELFPEDALPPRDAIAKALHALSEDCATRGVELMEVASGFRFQVRAELKPWVARLWTERQTRYSRALLETLSLIAYRQPITRGEIEQIRGVAVSTNIIRTLEEREWVRVIGYRDVPGKPALFGTTKGFLDYFNLKSLDQLPPLSELRDIPELEPQLAFDGPGNADENADGHAEGDQEVVDVDATEAMVATIDPSGTAVDPDADTDSAADADADTDADDDIDINVHDDDIIRDEMEVDAFDPEDDGIHDTSHDDDNTMATDPAADTSPDPEPTPSRSEQNYD